MSSSLKEQRIEFETPQFLHGLFANEPKHLSYLEDALGVKAVTREGWILLRGEELAVEVANRAFSDLEETKRSGGEISSREFKLAIDLAAKNDVRQKLSAVAELNKTKLLGEKGRKSIVPKTPQQKIYIETILTNDVVFGVGAAGTGKTYLAMAMAISLLLKKQVSRIILTRPAVEAGEALGFLPGDLQEKVAPYLRPLFDAMHDMLTPEQESKYLEDGVIEIAPLAYMRGRTLTNCFVILDEAQNTTPEQMFMLLTRIGENSKCVVTGDGSQVDLKKGVRSGLHEALTILNNIKGVSSVDFGQSDVVRHPVVARIIQAYEEHRNKGVNIAKN